MRKLTRRQQLGTVCLTVIALIFISLDFTAGSLGGSRRGATGAFGSLYRGTDGVLGPVRRFVQAIGDVGSNRSTIARLRAQNDQLRKQLSDAGVDRATAAQLKALQLQANSLRISMLPARVIATGPGAGFEWTVTVDVGSSAHVAVGQTVTNGLGLVGRVLTVNSGTSVVLLLSDPDSAVGLRDGRSGALLLATGAARAGLKAGSLAAGADVRVGDQLLTGPVGSTTFVANLPVATVTSVRTSSDGTVSMQLAATAPQTGLDLLGIISQPGAGVDRTLLSPVTG